MDTLTREQVVSRLLAGHTLEERGAGNVVVMLLDERVPVDVFNEFVRARLIEERRLGWWGISRNGQRRLKGQA